jgi:hypothetical protein
MEETFQQPKRLMKEIHLMKVFLSTARAFVDQQQFIFDMLWHKTVPARLERRIYCPSDYDHEKPNSIASEQPNQVHTFQPVIINPYI